MSLSEKFGWRSGKLDNKKSTQQSQQVSKSNKEIQLLNGDKNYMNFGKKKQ